MNSGAERSTAWNDPHQFAAMAAAAAGSMEQLDLLSSILGTRSIFRNFKKSFVGFFLQQKINTKGSKELEPKNKGFMKHQYQFGSISLYSGCNLLLITRFTSQCKLTHFLPRFIQTSILFTLYILTEMV